MRTLSLTAPVVILLAAAQPASAADSMPASAALIPNDAIAVLHVSDPNAILDLALDPRLISIVTSSPAYQANTSSTGWGQFQNAVRFLEGSISVDWQTALRKLTGGGLTWAIAPRDSHLLIIDTEDPKMLTDLHNVLLLIARNEAGKKGQRDRVRSIEYGNATAWTFGPNEAHAILGNRLLVSNRPELIKAAIDLRADPGGASLANSADFLAASEAVEQGQDAMVYANMSALRRAPKIQDALKPDQNPLSTLLFAGLTEPLQTSPWLAVDLAVEEDGLAFRAIAKEPKSVSSSVAKFTQPSDVHQGAMPNLTVPQQIAGASLFRDLHRFYASKDELFPERTSQLIFFENMMGIFFTGRDLTEEVLAETAPGIRFVVAEQNYDSTTAPPAAQLPAFAAVIRLKNAERFAPVVEEAWQKALGLINFTRGQQALPGLIIDRREHRGTKFTLAYFAPSAEDDDSTHSMRYNLRPSLAMPDDYLILSSTDKLAEHLIDALALESNQGVKPQAGVHNVVEIHGGQLSSILAANRESLVRQNMVEDGNSREQAETGISILLTAIRLVDRLSLLSETRGNLSWTSVQLQFNLQN